MADAQLSEGVVVTVDQKGVVYIDDRIVNLDQFEGTLKTAYDKSEIKKVFIRADEAVSHGRVVEVMGHIKSAGIIEVGLVTREPEIPARQRQGRR
jgi:biopolymer transport protein TolR